MIINNLDLEVIVWFFDSKNKNFKNCSYTKPQINIVISPFTMVSRKKSKPVELEERSSFFFVYFKSIKRTCTKPIVFHSERNASTRSF